MKAVDALRAVRSGPLDWLRSRWATLLVAILLGLAATMAVQRHMDATLAAQARALAPPEPEPPPPTRAVVVPAEPLVSGTVLAAHMLAHREVPETFLHASAIPAATFEGLIGRELRIDAEAGRPLLDAHIGAERPQRLSEALEPGRRAVSVSVNVENGMAGFLTPGDLIDIDWIDDTGEGVRTRAIAERVRIIAAGAHVTNPRDAQTTEQTSYSTLTLDVSPRDARRIAMAARGGRLLATLRHPEDVASSDVDRVSLSFDEPKRAAPEPRVSATGLTGSRLERPPPIEYIIGGRS